MDIAFSYDYSRFIQATFSDSEKLPQNHYKKQSVILLGQIEESIGYKAMLQCTSALIKH